MVCPQLANILLRFTSTGTCLKAVRGDHHMCTAPTLSTSLPSCGNVFGTPLSKMSGLLGTVKADNAGRATFYYTSDQFSIPDLIGRSMLVHSGCGPYTTAR